MPTSVVESQVYIVGHYFPQWAKCFIKAPWESHLDQGETTVLLTEPSLNSDNQRLAAALLGAWLLSHFLKLGWDSVWLRYWTASVLQEIADHNETELFWFFKWQSAFVPHNRGNLTPLLFHKGPLHCRYINRPFILLLLITIVQIPTAQNEMRIHKLNHQPFYLLSTYNT